MATNRYEERLARCVGLMEAAGLDALLLSKPANMFYLTGDGRLCAYTMVTRDGRVALGVPMTDVEDVRALACFDLIAGPQVVEAMSRALERAGYHLEENG